MTTKTNNKPTHKDQDTKVMSGVDVHFATTGTMTIGGEQFTPATLKAVFQDDIDAINESDAAATTQKLKVQAAKAARKRAAKVRQAIKRYLVGQYGPEAVQILEDFGFPAPKPLGPKTVKAKAAAQQKAGATRASKKAVKAAAVETPAPANPATK